MFLSKKIMEPLPNINLLGPLIMTYTLVFRKKALIPIYVYILLDGLFVGFSIWWIPYLYVWVILWAVTMMLPREINKKTKYIVYPIVCCLYGLTFGTLYSPAQALLAGMSFQEMIEWIIIGLPYDAIHGAGNLVLGFLIVPLTDLLNKLKQN